MADALTLAAGKLVRITLHVHRVEPDRAQKFGHPRPQWTAFQLGMPRADRFRQRVEHGHPGIERGVRVLEDHLEVDPLAPDLGIAHRGQLMPLEPDLSRSRPDKLHDRAAEGRLATTRFTDKAEDFAPANRQ